MTHVARRAFLAGSIAATALARAPRAHAQKRGGTLRFSEDPAADGRPVVGERPQDAVVVHQRQIQPLTSDDVLYVPWGQFVVPNALGKNVQGVLQFGATLLWNISV
jgi:hypothetical protein